MKVIKKFLVITLLTTVGYFIYLYFFTANNSTNAINLVPKDAVYIIQTKKPIKAWREFSKSELWQHLKNYPDMKEIAVSANALDAMIKQNKTLFSVFPLNDLIISSHVVSATNYEFLFLTDLSSASKSSLLKVSLNKIFSLANFDVALQDYKGTEINICKNRVDKSTLYVSLVANYLACSYSPIVLKASIDEYNNPSYKDKEKYTLIAEKTATNGLAQFYVNYANLAPFLRVYMGAVDPSFREMMEHMYFSGLNAEIDESYLKLAGYTNVNDSMPEMLSALAKSGKSDIGIHKVLSEKTALLMRLGFDDFNTFLSNSAALSPDLSSKSTRKKLKLLEIVLGISIEKDLFSWIGNEICVSQNYNEKRTGAKVPKIIAIKVNDKNNAKEKLDLIYKKMRRRMPFKFEKYEFRGYEIRYMETKGLFQLLFGKVFSRVEKPFVCMIGDYVLFCDDAKTLLQTIVDYEEGSTLSNENAFKYVKKDISDQSSFFAYVSPKLYFNNFDGLLTYAKFKEMEKNKQYITCFNGTGFSLKAEGNGLFKTEMGSSFLKENLVIIKEEDLEEEALEGLDEIDLFIIQSLNGNAVKNYFSDGSIASIMGVNENNIPEGNFTEYWENSNIKTKGRYKNGEKIGTWRYYNEDGKLIEKVKISK